MYNLDTTKFVDQLVTLRNELIGDYIAQYELQARLFATCKQIDLLVPKQDGCHIDTAEHFLYDMKKHIGDHAKVSRGTFRPAKGADEIKMLATRAADSTLWRMLYNRLGISALLGKVAAAEFNESLQNPPELTPERIRESLTYVLNESRTFRLEGLLSSLRASDLSYSSNSEKCFLKRTVFEDAVHFVSQSYFKLNRQSHFTDVVNALSYFLFDFRVKACESSFALEKTSLLAAIEQRFAGYSVRNPAECNFEFAGGEIRFYKKGTAHLVLDDNVVDYLNAQFSELNIIRFEPSEVG